MISNGHSPSIETFSGTGIAARIERWKSLSTGGYRVRDKRKMKMTEFMILSRRVFLRDNSLCRKTRTILVMALRSDFITAQ